VSVRVATTSASHRRRRSSRPWPTLCQIHEPDAPHLLMMARRGCSGAWAGSRRSPAKAVTDQTLGQNIAALAVLLGKAPEHFNTRRPGMDAVAIPRVPPGLPSDPITRRPDVRMAEEQLKSAGHSVESARAAYFPTISLTTDLGVQTAALRRAASCSEPSSSSKACWRSTSRHTARPFFRPSPMWSRC
jgi:hypothetical protein